MKAMDSIIGYTAIKHELKQISDTLKKRDFLSKLAEALLSNVIITMSDVKKIKDSCRITPVYL